MRAALLLVTLLATVGCSRSDEKTEVVLYCSADQEFAEQVVAAFEAAHPDIRILPRYDTEQTKTTGLVQRLRAERANPQADVFWSSEVFLTVQLADEGVFEPVAEWAGMNSPNVDPQGRWHGFAARARVLCWDPSRTDDPPLAWTELAEPRYRDRVVIADHNFGTTRGHVAAWFALWGEEAARDFLTSLKDNGIRVVASNSQTVREVIAGRADFAMTDTDDVWAQVANGYSLELGYLRHSAGEGMGTLLIPNTVALVAGRPGDRTAARALADYLLSEDVERLLLESSSRNLPILHAGSLAIPEDVLVPDPLALDYASIASAMPGAVAAADEILLDR